MVNERTPFKKASGEFDVDALTSLTSKMNVITQRLDRLNVIVVIAYVPSPPWDSYRPFGHVTLNCQIGSPFAQSSSG